ncbi:MAG TPA: peptide deformylase, partial [Thermodesulfobacteriota bacterium]|nr:peptide deformylase [Thermodesulfobacteriota bacterium]
CYKKPMPLLQILHFPNPVLKEKSRPVVQIDPEIRRLACDMAETMYAAPGVGLAAPQVGHPVRLAVIDVTPADQPRNLLVLINPEIVETEGECTWEEGCLSVPDCNEEVKRSEKVVVRFQNLDGEIQEVTGEGLLAIALQHEIDHLDGILFIDRLSPLKRRLLKRKYLREQKEKSL